MDLSEIKKEIEALDGPSQREMIGFLLSLQMRRDPEWRAELTRRLADRDPENWITLDDAEERLSRVG